MYYWKLKSWRLAEEQCKWRSHSESFDKRTTGWSKTKNEFLECSFAGSLSAKEQLLFRKKALSNLQPVSGWQQQSCILFDWNQRKIVFEKVLFQKNQKWRAHSSLEKERIEIKNWKTSCLGSDFGSVSSKLVILNDLTLFWRRRHPEFHVPGQQHCCTSLCTNDLEVGTLIIDEACGAVVLRWQCRIGIRRVVFIV